MIKSVLNNEILNRITDIEHNRYLCDDIKLPVALHNKLRKNSKKKSTYASNKIEGNPLSEQQVSKAIDSDPHKHFLKPEQEVRNYYLALNLLEEKCKEKQPFSKKLILEVQKLVEKGASKEKIGFRGEMPVDFIFGVYDSSGELEYIPPIYSELEELIDELVEYVNTTDDHPLIVAAIVHYQLVTIHAFEDGNGRTARLMSGYILDLNGYGFGGVGSLEEYFAYDSNEYYESLQMGLPANYYYGRENPPHPEIWLNYFLRMFQLYSQKVLEISNGKSIESVENALTHLNEKEKQLLMVLVKNNFEEFSPIAISKKTSISNRTIINRLVNLTQNGFVIPIIVKERIRSYKLSDFTINNKEEIIKHI